MNINTEIRLLRLNYEYCKLIDIIKTYDPTVWDQLHKLIEKELGNLLGDYEVAIGSDYSIFDDCIRQVPDLYPELMSMYEDLIKNYRQVLGMGSMLPYNEICELLKGEKAVRVIDEINALFNFINTEIAGDGYMTEAGIFVNNTQYFNFKLTINNLALLDVMTIELPSVNSERFIEDVRLYIDAVVTYDVLCKYDEFN